jgi:excisionase family DNA binding protein
LLTTDALAELLGVPKNTIYAWRYKRCGPPGIKVGRYVKYRRADVEKWLEQQMNRAS